MSLRCIVSTCEEVEGRVLPNINTLGRTLHTYPRGNLSATLTADSVMLSGEVISPSGGEGGRTA